MGTSETAETLLAETMSRQEILFIVGRFVLFWLAVIVGILILKYIIQLENRLYKYIRTKYSKNAKPNAANNTIDEEDDIAKSYSVSGPKMKQAGKQKQGNSMGKV